MILLRVLSAELLKLRRTNALRLVAIAPLSIVVLLTFFFTQAPSMLGRQREDSWISLARIMFVFWALLVLPLYIALQTALVAALEHAENQWKLILARPLPRWTVYVAKLFVVAGFTSVSGALLLGGILVSGLILRSPRFELHFGPIPYSLLVASTLRITFLALLSLAIQHWVALRFRSFTVAVGTGIVAMMTGYGTTILASRDLVVWTRYFPWTLPMMEWVRPPIDTTPLLWFSGIVGLVVATAGCIDFSRRDVQ
jgi:lantibiotic transport system permease protein